MYTTCHAQVTAIFNFRVLSTAGATVEELLIAGMISGWLHVKVSCRACVWDVLVITTLTQLHACR